MYYLHGRFATQKKAISETVNVQVINKFPDNQRKEQNPGPLIHEDA
jgi:hypothetical protein